MVKGDGHAYVPLETVAPVVEALLPVMDEVRLQRARKEGTREVNRLEGVALADDYNATELHGLLFCYGDSAYLVV